MQFAIHKHSTVKVFLCTDTEFLVLIQHLPVESIDSLELLIRRIFVSKDFILNFALRRRNRDHTLYIKELVPMEQHNISLQQFKPELHTYVTVIEVVGKK